MKPSRSRRIALISVFAALGVVCDSILTPGFSAGVWYGWIFMLSPLTGVVLGPRDGFVATLISVMVGHSLAFRDVYEYFFTFGAPLCSLASGYVFRGKLGRVLLLYTILLSAYFLTPVSWTLPIWGMWDCHLAYATIIAATILTKRSILKLRKGSMPQLALSAFLGLEADVMFRIFLFVPCQTYRIFYGFTPETLRLIWTAPALIITPLKVGLSTLFTAIVGPHILRVLEERGLYTAP